MFLYNFYSVKQGGLKREFQSVRLQFSTFQQK